MKQKIITYDQMLLNGYIYVLHVRYKKRIDKDSTFDLSKPFKRILAALKYIQPLLNENDTEQIKLCHIKRQLIIKYWHFNKQII